MRTNLTFEGYGENILELQGCADIINGHRGPNEFFFKMDSPFPEYIIGIIIFYFFMEEGPLAWAELTWCAVLIRSCPDVKVWNNTTPPGQNYGAVLDYRECKGSRKVTGETELGQGHNSADPSQIPLFSLQFGHRYSYVKH